MIILMKVRSTRYRIEPVGKQYKLSKKTKLIKRWKKVMTSVDKYELIDFVKGKKVGKR